MTITCKKCLFFCAVLTCVVLVVGCQSKKSGPSAVAQKDGAVVEELDVVEVIPAPALDKSAKSDKKVDEAKPETGDNTASAQPASVQNAAETPAAPAANEAKPTDNAPAAESESQSAYIWDENSAVESDSTFGHRRRASYGSCTINSCCVPACAPCGPACGPACGPSETYVPACGPCAPSWGGKWGCCGRRAWRAYCDPCAPICNPCAPCGINGCDSSGCEGSGCDGNMMNSQQVPAETPQGEPSSQSKSTDQSNQSGLINQLPVPTVSDYRQAGASQAIGSDAAEPVETPTPAPTPAPEPKPETETK